MLDTSWKAIGRVRAAWLRLDVEKDQRGKLAELTGIPASNLSGLNTGRLPMTVETAQRIAAAVPGLSVLELGASLTAVDAAGQTLLERLEEVAAEAKADAVSIRKDLRAAIRRIRALEQRAQLGDPGESVEGLPQ